MASGDASYTGRGALVRTPRTACRWVFNGTQLVGAGRGPVYSLRTVRCRIYTVSRGQGRAGVALISRRLFGAGKPMGGHCALCRGVVRLM